MTLWFDVTDIHNWTHPHLTGIQRTSVGVLSELLATRKDLQLFVFVPSDNVLRPAEVHSLPEIVRDCIFREKPPLSRAMAPISYTPKASFPARVRGYIFRTSRSLKASFRRQPRKWLGPEITNALKEALKAARNLVRAIWRKLFGIGPVRTSSPAFNSVSAESVLFKRGDVCISLSATWGLPHYGDTIAANTRQSGAKCINLIYDLIPTLYPQWVLPDHHVFITAWVRQQIENADLILTISEFQKKEISKYIVDQRLSLKPIEFVQLGDNPNFKASATGDEPLPLPRFVPDRKFAIFVSTIDVRKNQGLLYHVWCRLAEELGSQCPQLLLIGSEHLHVSDILYQIRTDSRVRGLVVHLRNITDKELAWYYRNCAFTIYPSIYEGWGLPISESLSLGRYCIAGNRTSLPEAGGDLVDYFDPFDFAACYNLVYRAVTDPEYVRQCEERIRTNYVPHTWAMTAAHISEIVDRVGSLDRQAAVG